MLNIAIVGYDHAHLPRYAPALAAHPRLTLTALVAPGANRDLARQHAERFGARYLERLDDLWAGEPVQAVYLGTPPSQHRAVIQAAAARGVHILCDKPLATTLTDADAILAAVRGHGVTLMVPFNPRYQLPVMKLKALLEAGELGQLQALAATKYGKLPRGIPGLDTAWFFDPAQAGFGGFGDIGIHALDALRWLAGAEPRRVFARIERHLHRDIAVDDIGTAVVEFTNGVVGTLSAGWGNPAGNPAWLSVSFEALGSRGAALIDKPYHDLEVADDTRLEQVAWWRVDIPRLVDEFVRAVEAGRPPAITGTDARAALELTLACYASARRGEAVTLPLGAAA